MRTVTVLGGTGFLGRRVVYHLRQHGFAVRIAARHPERGRTLFGTGDEHLQSVPADIHDPVSVAEALAGAYGAVNAVSLYVEHGNETFRSVHVEAAQRAAAEAKRAGLQQFVLVSGTGADAQSRSPYIRSRGEGEHAVRAAFGGSTIVRPAVMFGAGDAFLGTLVKLVRRLPVYPMFGNGATRLQPVYVDDVAEAIARAVERAASAVMTFECGGPRVYTYEDLVRVVAGRLGRKPILVPMPFVIWRASARLAELLPKPPLTRNQVELMQIDNVASGQVPGFADLGISPHSLEEILDSVVQKA